MDYLVMMLAIGLCGFIPRLMLERLWLMKKTKEEQKELRWVVALIGGFGFGLGLALGFALKDYYHLNHTIRWPD